VLTLDDVVLDAIATNRTPGAAVAWSMCIEAERLRVEQIEAEIKQGEELTSPITKVTKKGNN